MGGSTSLLCVSSPHPALGSAVGSLLGSEMTAVLDGMAAAGFDLLIGSVLPESSPSAAGSLPRARASLMSVSLTPIS